MKYNGSFSFLLIAKLQALKAILNTWTKEVFGRVGENKSEALCRVIFWDDQERARMLSLEEAKERKSG